LTAGFRSVAFGDAAALEAAIDDSVVAFLLEPVQGEAGVIVAPDGYLREVRRLCSRLGGLLIADEIQSGLGRTGRTFACDHEGVVPDLHVLGKALGGGIVPLSAVVADDDVLGVLRPGEHGSTFGDNPLACAIGRAVIELLATGELQANARGSGRGCAAASMPPRRRQCARSAPGACGSAWRSRQTPERRDRRASGLLSSGVLAKETHE
jgi:ornithine--oxo-acid transaminase